MSARSLLTILVVLIVGIMAISIVNSTHESMEESASIGDAPPVIGESADNETDRRQWQ